MSCIWDFLGWLHNTVIYPYRDDIIAISTFFIAIFTVVLACIGRRQAKDTKILQRAYIRAVPMGISAATDQYLIGHVMFENVGKLPATNFRWVVKDLTKEGPEWKPPILTDADLLEFSSYIPIAGQFRRGTARAIPETSNEYWFVWGRVKYLDGFGHERFVNFCHSYPVARRVHNPTDDPMMKAEVGYSIAVEYARYHDHGNGGD